MERLPYLLAATIVLFFGIGQLLLGYIPIKKKRNIRVNGKSTKAEIVGIFPTLSDRFNYAIKLRYATDDGKTVVATWNEYKRKPWCRKHPIGSTIDILYISGEKPQFDVKGISPVSIMQIFMIVVGMGLFIFSGYMYYMALFVDLSTL